MKISLSTEKKKQLVLVALGTGGVIAGLWFALISAQNAKMAQVEKKLQGLRDEIAKVDQVVKEAARVDSDLKIATERLAQIESTMPSGDSYLWMNSTLKQFNKSGYKVEMPAIGIPVISEMNMLPAFPYHQATSTVTGNAYYCDFGRFVADFENQFPYMRIQNLNLEPTGAAEDPEKLSFRMEIVTLIKSGSI